MIRADLTKRLPVQVTRPVAIAWLLIVLVGLPGPLHARCSLSIDANEARVLADRIWQNESGGNFDKILWWNRGENFASAGIGHFIWYPEGLDEGFHESFPEVLSYLTLRGVTMPEWLEDENARHCPWPTREEFFAQRTGRKARELRQLLVDTRDLQAAFMLARLEAALDRIVATVPVSESAVFESRFCALAATSSGRYALVDYVNFKGEGIDPGERYQGQGWGLKQVLEEMDGKSPPSEVFADAAATVLERRVRNAPPGRREQRWLQGWLRRVDSYRSD